MPLEIERKFLVESVPPDVRIESEVEIAQGYLALGSEQVRLRRQGDQTLLTAKHGAGLVREEVEVPIPAEAFEQLWELTEGRRLEKTRRRSPFDGLTIQIDVYRGRLAGLTVAEVEFPDEAAAHHFSPPAWFSRELTGDARYSNQRLAVDGLP